MIPKTIHYCWFGGNPLPELAQKCIESWKKFCPDYEIIQWDETNFDINQNDYCREAYEAKKWAFVSDYARLKILYEYGGIYMDTDVELLKNIELFINADNLSVHSAFSATESEKYIAAGVMGCEPKHSFFKKLIETYENTIFNKDSLVTIVSIITEVAKDYGFKPTDKLQEVNNFLTIYPKEFFYPKNFVTGELCITENTYAIHHYDGSWVSEQWKWRSKFIQKYYKFLGKTGARYLSLVIYCIKESEWKQIGNKIKKHIRKVG